MRVEPPVAVHIPFMPDDMLPWFKRAEGLEQLIGICRRNGVPSLVLDGLSLVLGPDPNAKPDRPEPDEDNFDEDQFAASGIAPGIQTG